LTLLRGLTRFADAARALFAVDSVNLYRVTNTDNACCDDCRKHSTPIAQCGLEPRPNSIHLRARFTGDSDFQDGFAHSQLLTLGERHDVDAVDDRGLDGQRFRYVGQLGRRVTRAAAGAASFRVLLEDEAGGEREIWSQVQDARGPAPAARAG